MTVKKWKGETITWTTQLSDKLKEYWTGCGEHYYFEIHASVIGFKLYVRNGEHNPLKLIFTDPKMQEARAFAEKLGASL